MNPQKTGILVAIIIILVIAGLFLNLSTIFYQIDHSNQMNNSSNGPLNHQKNLIGAANINCSMQPYFTYSAGGTVIKTAMSTDGQFIVAGVYSVKNQSTGRDEGRVYAFNRSGSLLWVNKPGATGSAESSFVADAAVSAENQYVAVLNYYGELYYFDKNGTLLWWKGRGESQGKNVAVSDSGDYIARGTGSHNWVDYYFNNGTSLWYFTTYNLESSPDGHDFTGVHVAISADGRNVAAVSEDSRVYYFNQNGSLLWSNITGYSLENVAMSSDGKYIAVASRDHNVYYYNATGSRLWNFTTGDVVKSVAIDADGQYIAVGSNDSRVYLLGNDKTLHWDYSTGGPVKTVAMSRDGQTVAAGSEDHTLYCFNQSGTLLWKYITEGKVKSVAVSGDGKYIAAGSEDGNVYFFNRDGSDKTA